MQYFYFIWFAIIVKTITADQSTTTIATPPNALVDELAKETSSPSSDDDPNLVKEIKREANQRSQHKFNSPIIVNEDLFTPAGDGPRKQINVQIIEPESHNNGQYLRETIYKEEENSTVVSSTTSSTTERTTTTEGAFSSTTHNILLAPIQAGVRLSGETKQRLEEDCDEPVSSPKPIQREEIKTVVNVHKKVIRLPTKRPCTTNCEQKTGYLPPPLPTPVKPLLVTQPPIIVHTQTEVPVDRIVEKPYPVIQEKLVEKIVRVPYAKVIDRPYEVEKLVVQQVEVPVDRVVEKIVDRPVPYPVEKLVDRPITVEKIVEKPVQVDRIIEKFIDRPVEIEKIVEVEKEVHVPVDRIIDRIIDRPVEVEKIVEKQVLVPNNQIIDRPVPYPVDRVIDRLIPIQVGIPVEVPYLVHVPPVHIPYFIKPPPPQPKSYFIKTTKGKDEGFFDFHKHNHHKTIKHIFLKQPNIISDDQGHHQHHHHQPYPFYTFGLLAPPISYSPVDPLPPSIPNHQQLIREPRYQSLDSYASGSVNVVNALPPTSLNSLQSHHFYPHKGHHHHISRPDYSGGLNVKELRWEFGFKPPLVPSTEIDDFGNPIKKHFA